ncbi:MAG TPA: SDR family NAD(P)-dependent oxidoreductase [Mucilaginibacter sp.]|nr:SDR family NAD(P)-dependent oxidoreductase [Mucilaginibacter sp.]
MQLVLASHKLAHFAMNDENKITRRQVVAGLGTTLAAVAVSPALAATSIEHSAETGTTRISDPRPLYPKPPFKSQPQPWPGLQSKMDPVPDCGENSYKGSGRLMGRKALITGGDSGMGRAAAIAYAREGADVAIVYYPTEEPDAQQVIALIKKEGRKAVAMSHTMEL